MNAPYLSVSASWSSRYFYYCYFGQALKRPTDRLLFTGVQQRTVRAAGGTAGLADSERLLVVGSFGRYFEIAR